MPGYSTLYFQERLEDKALKLLSHYGVTEFDGGNNGFALHVFTQTIGLFESQFLPDFHIMRACCLLRMVSIS